MHHYIKKGSRTNKSVKVIQYVKLVYQQNFKCSVEMAKKCLYFELTVCQF